MLVYHPLPDGILNLALCGQKSRGDNDGSLTVIFHAVHDVLNEQQINRHRFLLAGRNFRNTRKETVRLRPLLLDSITGGGKVQFEGRISCLVGILLQSRGRLMLHLKMGRVQQRVALNDMPQRLCHAVEHHVQAQEPSGFGRDVLRINNGTVQAVLLTEFMGQMQHQGAGAGSGVGNLRCLDFVTHSDKTTGDDGAHRLRSEVFRIHAACHIIVFDEVLKNGGIEVKRTRKRTGEIKFILCDDAKDILGKVVAVGRFYGSGNRLEQWSVAALSRLHSKDVIPGILGYANQRIIELLVEIGLLYMVDEVLDGILIAECHITGSGVIECVQLVILVFQNFLDGLTDFFRKLGQVIHELIVQELIEEHRSNDALLLALIGKASLCAQSFQLVNDLLDFGFCFKNVGHDYSPRLENPHVGIGLAEEVGIPVLEV